MIPQFSFTSEGRWRIKLVGSSEEVEVLQSRKFDHRIVFKGKYEDEEPIFGGEDDDVRWKTISREHATPLSDFKADDGTPIGCSLLFRVDDRSIIEEWEAQVIKRVAAITADIAKLIPEPEPTAPELDEHHWQAHAVLMSKAGSGKTNAMRWRILQILKEVERGRATIVIIEPKGTLIESILNLRQTYELRDRVCHIDPEDTTNPVAINIFDRGSGSDRDRNTSLAMAKYVMGTLAMSLTPNHRQILEAVVQLMFVLPDEPCMDTLMTTLRYGTKGYERHFDKLTRATQSFFQSMYSEEKSAITARKQELLNRLNAVLGQPTFDRLLYQSRSSLNLVDVINEGSLILINANEGYLGFGEDTRLYGKFWTAQLYKAGMARYHMLKQGHDLKPCWVFIDELQQFCSDDDMFASGLNLLREAKVSSFFSMHYLTQIEKLSVRDAITTNTAIKFSAIPESDYHFECEAPRMKSRVKFPFIDYRDLPQATSEEVEEIRELSRFKYGKQQPDEPSEPISPPPPSDDRGGFGKL